MPTFGSYISVQELHRTALGCVYSARRADEEGPEAVRFAVKTCEPDPAILGESAAGAEVERFLGQAAAQQGAGGPGSGMAPVHEIGRIEGTGGGAGAYYATDLARRGSCERMSTGASGVDAAGLKNIVTRAAGALIRLKESGRVHGNLHAANVLLMDAAPNHAVTVELCDPLPEGLAKGGFERDVRALGELIYRLVMRRRFSGAWPVEDSAEWQRLGRGGQAWRGLCNRLLEQTLGEKSGEGGGDGGGLEIERVPALIPEPAVAGRGKWLAGAGVAVLVLVMSLVIVLGRGGGTRLSAGDFIGEAYKKDDAASNFKALIAMFNTEERGWAGLIAKDLELKNYTIPNDLHEKSKMYIFNAQSKRNQIIGEGDPRFLEWNTGKLEEAINSKRDLRDFKYMSDAAVKDARDAITGLDDYRQWVMTAWDAAKRVVWVRDLAAASTWGNAQQYLADIIKVLEAAMSKPGEVPGGDRPDVPKCLQQVDKAAAAVANVEDLVKGVQAAAAKLGEVGSKGGAPPFPGRFQGAWPSLVGEGLSEEKKGFASLGDLVNSLEAVKDLGDRLAHAATRLGEGLPGVVTSGVGAPAGEVQRADFESWVKAAEVFNRMRADAEALSERLAAFKRRYKESKRLEGLERESPGLQDAVRRIGSALGSPDPQSVELAGVSTLQGKLIETLKTLTDAGQAEEVLEHAGLEALRIDLQSKNISSIGAVNLRWKVWRDELIGRMERLSLDAATDEAKELERLFKDFEQSAGLTGGGADIRADESALGGAIAEAEARGRSVAVESAFATLSKPGAGTGVLNSELERAAQQVKKTYGELAKSYQDLALDVETIGANLEEGLGVDGVRPGGRSAGELWAGVQKSPLVQDASVKMAVSELGERMEAHKHLGRLTSAEELAAAIDAEGKEGGKKRFDVAKAAWERLIKVQGPGEVSWPENPGELKKAAGLAGSVEKLMTGIRDVERREKLVMGVRGQAQSVWEGFATRQLAGASETKATRQAALSAAFVQRGTFKVDDDSLNGLLRVNAAVDSFRVAMKEMEPKKPSAEEAVVQARVSLGKLRSSVENAGVENRALVDSVVKELGLLLEGRKKVDLTQLGPGEMDHVTGILNDDRSLGFDLSGLPGDKPGDKPFGKLKGQTALVFVPVQVGKDEDVVYIARDEVSVQLFIAVYSNDLETTRQLKRKSFPQSSLWDGPSPTSLKEVNKKNTLIRNVHWISIDEAYVKLGKNDLPGDLGEEPKPESPMTRVSAATCAAACKYLHCRLPTVQEWQAAFKLDEHDSSKANLRDTAFVTQCKYINDNWAAGGAGNVPGFPDEQSFSPDVHCQEAAKNDRTLWFWTVATDPSGGRFRNLIGNVAEWVVDGTDYAVIGGSALSKVPAAFDEPVAWKGVENPWDVGFRPAFSAKDAQFKPVWEAALDILKAKLGGEMVIVE